MFMVAICGMALMVPVDASTVDLVVPWTIAWVLVHHAVQVRYVECLLH